MRLCFADQSQAWSYTQHSLSLAACWISDVCLYTQKRESWDGMKAKESVLTTQFANFLEIDVIGVWNIMYISSFANWRFFSWHRFKMNKPLPSTLFCCDSQLTDELVLHITANEFVIYSNTGDVKWQTAHSKEEFIWNIIINKQWLKSGVYIN